MNHLLTKFSSYGALNMLWSFLFIGLVWSCSAVYHPLWFWFCRCRVVGSLRRFFTIIYDVCSMAIFIRADLRIISFISSVHTFQIIPTKPKLKKFLPAIMTFLIFAYNIWISGCSILIFRFISRPTRNIVPLIIKLQYFLNLL